MDGLNTLIDFRYQQHFFAKSGQHGMGAQRTGASGDDIVLSSEALRPKGSLSAFAVGPEELDTAQELYNGGTAQGTDFLLGSVHSHRFHGNYHDEAARLWGRDGTLLATGTQLMYFKG